MLVNNGRKGDIFFFEIRGRGYEEIYIYIEKAIERI